MRLLVVGAGATGGYFGGRLAAAGRDVTFLVRDKRAAQLRRDGLVIKSPHGDLTLPVKFLTAGELREKFDIVLVTVKAFGLDAAIDDFTPAVGPDTMVVPVLNGMKHMDVLQAKFGKALVGGVCRVATTIDAEGHVHQLAGFQELLYGELGGASSARTDALNAFMKDCGFEAKLSTHIVQELWNKWIMLASMGGVTNLMRGTVGEIVAAPNGETFIRAFIDEVVAIATAAGHAPAPNVRAAVDAMLTARGSSLASSMYRDLQQGGAIEADHIVGDFLARGEKAGVRTPLLSAAYTHLCVYQNRLAQKARA